MKKISVVVPCYNEEENVCQMAEAITKVFKESLTNYDYEIIFIDNCSKDKTRVLLNGLCADDKKIKAIFNMKNFGQFNSPYYGLCQITGDCGILIACDFQDPVEMIPSFVSEWENGYKVVCGIKTKSKEGKMMYFFRGIYYKLVKKFSTVEQISQFTGFALYDKSFVNVLDSLEDSTPFLRGIVAELGPERKEIPYTQPKRRAGKTSNNFARLYDGAMISFTAYTKVGVRMIIFLGLIAMYASFVLTTIFMINDIFARTLVFDLKYLAFIGLFLFGINMFFMGIIGEYVLNINTKMMKRPLVVEDKRINFEENDK